MPPFWHFFSDGRIEGFAVFLMGFWEKLVFGCGFFLVSLWWNAWLLWTGVTTLRGA
jgi:hypothetical protein